MSLINTTVSYFLPSDSCPSLPSHASPFSFVLEIVPYLLATPSCFTKLLSTAVGLAIILASSMIKVPQILAILRAQSASGLSLPSLAFEIFCYEYNLAHYLRQKLPISTFGEYILILTQNIILLLLCIHFTTHSPPHIAAALLSTATSMLLLLFAFPTRLLTALISLNAAAPLLTRLPQVVANFRTGDTGALSGATFGGLALGALARVGTTMRDVTGEGKGLIVAGYAVSSVLNGVIAAQVLASEMRKKGAADGARNKKGAKEKDGDKKDGEKKKKKEH